MAFADAQASGTILYGDSEAQVILAGAVTRGDCLGYSSGWKRALATTAAVIAYRCVAGEDGVTGQSIKVYFGNVLIGGSRFSGGTANGALYVAESTDSGKYTQTAPSTVGIHPLGDLNVAVGVMITPTIAMIAPTTQDTIAHT